MIEVRSFQPSQPGLLLDAADFLGVFRCLQELETLYLSSTGPLDAIPKNSEGVFYSTLTSAQPKLFMRSSIAPFSIIGTTHKRTVLKDGFVGLASFGNGLIPAKKPQQYVEVMSLLLGQFSRKLSTEHFASVLRTAEGYRFRVMTSANEDKGGYFAAVLEKELE